MRTVAIIQARMGSTRLPGKVAKRILGMPMLEHMLRREKMSRTLDDIVVATTNKSEDDVVEVMAKACGVSVYRGSEHDVLDRYYQAAKEAKADVVVRVTGDCPLHYGVVIDETVERFLQQKVDYVRSPSNYPEGLDTEVFWFAALERAWREGKLPSEREHVTPYIYTHPELFVLGEPWQRGVENNSSMHWSVDSPKDLVFITAIFERLYPNNPLFVKEEVFAFLKENLALLNINKGATGYEGYAKSLEEDKKFKP